MTRSRGFVVLLCALAGIGADLVREPNPSSIDYNQAHTFRTTARLLCRQIHRDHAAGRSPDDCVMVGGTMEARVGAADEDVSWALDLSSLWCEGNHYAVPQSRFQLRSQESCSQVCDRDDEDRRCITEADLGREARSRPGAWRHVGEFRLVARPEERAPRCSDGQEHAEAWSVDVLSIDLLSRRAHGLDPIPDYTKSPGPLVVHVVCPDGVEIGRGDRFRALVAYGDRCLPWPADPGSPCLYRVEPIARPTP